MVDIPPIYGDDWRIVYCCSNHIAPNLVTLHLPHGLKKICRKWGLTHHQWASDVHLDHGRFACGQEHLDSSPGVLE